ncbi:MAG: hypothetical protein GY775_20760 [Candidatus Scalindua sp.]|nr:hypothetical protein [Candidatus Scalindua sp.]
MVVFGGLEVVPRLVRVIEMVTYDLWDMNDLWMTHGPICTALSCQKTTNTRPEERREEKENRSRWQPNQKKKKILMLEWFFYSVVP